MADGLLRSQNALGITDPVRDMSSGYKLHARDYANFYKTDDQLLDEFLLPKHRYRWEADGVTPIFEYETTQLPASLRAKVMASTVPSWGEHVTVEQSNKVALTIIAQAPWIPKAQRKPALDIGELTALPAPKTAQEQYDEAREQRKALLLRQAEAHLADPNRVTKPDYPPSFSGALGPSHSDPVEHAGSRDANGKAPAPSAPYVAPPKPVAFPAAPQGPTPSYVRRSAGPTQGVRANGEREPVRTVKI
jgi:hypothetical protein